MRLRLLTAALFACIAAPAAQAGVGPDYVASDNVEYVDSLKFDVAQTTGARIIGKWLYVTSAKNLSIYDISNPLKPDLATRLTLNIAWENEEVPTDGKILGISSDFFAFTPSCGAEAALNTSCLQLFDVRNPDAVKELPAVPASGDHTNTCILDCSYFYGSAGSITDLRGVLDGATPTRIGSWFGPIAAQLKAQGGPVNSKNSISCHHVREIRPGLIFGACNPSYFLMSVTDAEGGGTVANPKLLAWGKNADGRFVHSARWPRQGRDKFAFEGGETNFPAPAGPGGPCNTTKTGAFAVLDTSKYDEQGRLTPVGPQAEYRPKNGTYADGSTPVSSTGCSVHWFEEHPSFNDGGLVALAAYDNGTRFLKVASDGKVTEEGYFMPIGLETSSPKWVPGTDIVYSIDYLRGIDILRWKGEHYVPGKKEKGRIKGTHGKQPVLQPLTKGQRALALRTVSLKQSQGWFAGYCALVAQQQRA
jgi:hypothetical protein